MTPKNIQTLADQKVNELISNSSFKFKDWEGKRFASVKFASASEKGAIGEDFLHRMLIALGYKNVETLRGRKGPYDVGVKNGKKDVKFEVKTATLDIGGNFQFNGVRYDTKYTHLFFFGLLPNEIRYEIVDKNMIIGGSYTMTPMRKGSNSDFKITRPSARLSGFNQFGKDITKLLGAPK